MAILDRVRIRPEETPSPAAAPLVETGPVNDLDEQTVRAAIKKTQEWLTKEPTARQLGERLTYLLDEARRLEDRLQENQENTALLELTQQLDDLLIEVSRAWQNVASKEPHHSPQEQAAFETVKLRLEEEGLVVPTFQQAEPPPSEDPPLAETQKLTPLAKQNPPSELDGLLEEIRGFETTPDTPKPKDETQQLLEELQDDWRQQESAKKELDIAFNIKELEKNWQNLSEGDKYLQLLKLARSKVTVSEPQQKTIQTFLDTHKEWKRQFEQKEDTVPSLVADTKERGQEAELIGFDKEVLFEEQLKEFEAADKSTQQRIIRDRWRRYKTRVDKSHGGITPAKEARMEIYARLLDHVRNNMETDAVAVVERPKAQSVETPQESKTIEPPKEEERAYFTRLHARAQDIFQTWQQADTQKQDQLIVTLENYLEAQRREHGLLRKNAKGNFVLDVKKQMQMIRERLLPDAFTISGLALKEIRKANKQEVMQVMERDADLNESVERTDAVQVRLNVWLHADQTQRDWTKRQLEHELTLPGTPKSSKEQNQFVLKVINYAEQMQPEAKGKIDQEQVDTLMNLASTFPLTSIENKAIARAMELVGEIPTSQHNDLRGYRELAGEPQPPLVDLPPAQESSSILPLTRPPEPNYTPNPPERVSQPIPQIEQVPEAPAQEVAHEEPVTEPLTELPRNAPTIYADETSPLVLTQKEPALERPAPPEQEEDISQQVDKVVRAYREATTDKRRQEIADMIEISLKDTSDVGLQQVARMAKETLSQPASPVDLPPTETAAVPPVSKKGLLGAIKSLFGG